jgi:curved DNA-binding protein CbpA
MEDYYSTLGISRGSNTDVFKRAYRSLAAKYHPDAPFPDRDKFEAATEAYRVLGDEDQRKQYDLMLNVLENFDKPESTPKQKVNRHSLFYVDPTPFRYPPHVVEFMKTMTYPSYQYPEIQVVHGVAGGRII